MASQGITHIALTTPIHTKAHGQPQWTAIHGAAAGATIAPIFAPELKIPVANARSFCGNHSATVFTAAGKFAASLSPSTNRALANASTVRASECPIVARLQI